MKEFWVNFNIYNYLGGRSAAFALFFTIVGSVFHWYGKLDATYITFAGVMQTMVMGRSVAEDAIVKPQTITNLMTVNKTTVAEEKPIAQ